VTRRGRSRVWAYLMKRIGREAARLFRLLAGIEKNEPIRSPVIAIYSFLFLVAMLLVFVWASGAEL
jgi:hypothetical protein